jgi:hypothetical protein
MAGRSDQGRSGRRSESRSESSGSERRQSAKAAGPSDIKQREYRDEEGNVHHHTRTSRAMRERRSE